MSSPRRDSSRRLPLRRTSLAVGALYLVTHVTSLVATVLYAPLLGGDSSEAARGAARTGVLLEAALAIAVVGTAVGLYPVVRRWGPAFALGHVGLRVLEGAIILTGAASVLALDAVRADGEAASVYTALVGLHDATFWLGPNLVLTVSTALLATLLLRSRLVPRWIPVLGLVGCCSLLASAVAILYGVFPQVSTAGGVAAAPMFAWELSLAGYLLLVGMRERTASPAPAALVAPLP
ncbi:DUF4386 domain-containing protein [Leifsonia aquatica]|uniref:DUF4386 domain-containing protein n=1 Tax=Leifsonia aquatica TaxID=144185 RepID=UPI0004693784|nr:DUF4386 domain-containing protein [Leifsonia aquatica]